MSSSFSGAPGSGGRATHQSVRKPKALTEDGERQAAASRSRPAGWIFATVLSFTVAIWFASFPLLEHFEPVDILFDSAVLSASLLGLGFVRRARLPAMDLGWKFLIWGHLICLLDCFTQEKGVSPIAVSTAIFTSESATITAVMWGLHVYLSRRRSELQELRRVICEWRRSESRYAELVNAVDGVVWEADPNTGRYLFVSRKAEAMLGYPVSRWLEDPTFWSDHILPQDRKYATSFCIDETKGRRSQEFEYRMVAADGRTVWVRDLMSFASGADGEAHLCGVMVEIGASKQLEKVLRSKAMRDDLTGLPSRAAFLEALQALDERDEPGAPYGVMFLDLDHFKLINDTLGHRVGDTVLAEAAERIGRTVDGHGYVARIGGDEFAVLSTRLTCEEELLELASQIQREMEPPVTSGPRPVRISVSIGIATGTVGDGPADRVLQNADIAMYGAKGSSRGSKKLFDTAMRKGMDSAFKFEARLREAIKHNELETYYQPIIDFQEGEVVAVEALVRWAHPERGLLSASEFLPEAEKVGLAGTICWQATRRAFLQSRQWGERLRVAPLMTVNVNESGFAQPDFIEHLRRMVGDTGVDPSGVILEMTEDIIGIECDTDVKLEAMKEMGFHLALDDFGVGRSSLSRLLKMPIQMIKLDHAFMPQAARSREEALVRGVLAIGRDLGISIIAEGIESVDQCRRLRELGCRIGQGYLLGKAMPADETEALLVAAQAPGAALPCGLKGLSCGGCIGGSSPRGHRYSSSPSMLQGIRRHSTVTAKTDRGCGAAIVEALRE